MHEAGHSKLVLWNNSEGWGGRWEGGSGWGTHVHPGLIHVSVWPKPPQYCKVIILQLKVINFFKKGKNLWQLWDRLEGKEKECR